MKSLKHNRLLPLAIVAIVMVANANVSQAENKVSALWPFQKPAIKSPFSKAPSKSKGNALVEGPKKLFKTAEKQTTSLVNKTKSGFRGAQDFGRALNPFGKPKQNKKSFLDTVMPKRRMDDSPATMGEFLTMDRPGF